MKSDNHWLNLIKVPPGLIINPLRGLIFFLFLCKWVLDVSRVVSEIPTKIDINLLLVICKLLFKLVKDIFNILTI